MTWKLKSPFGFKTNDDFHCHVNECALESTNLVVCAAFLKKKKKARIQRLIFNVTSFNCMTVAQEFTKQKYTKLTLSVGFTGA